MLDLSGGKLGKVRCRVMGEAKGLLPGSALVRLKGEPDLLGTGGCLFEKDKGDGEIRRPPPTPRVWGEMFLTVTPSLPVGDDGLISRELELNISKCGGV